MDGFWGYRWESYSHDDLYRMVKTDARGAAVIEEADRAWSAFVEVMNASRERIDRLQREAGVSWLGQASEAMSDGVSPLGRWAEDAAAAGERSRQSLQQIIDGFTRTANAMPEPVPVITRLIHGMPADFSGRLAGQTDADAADQQAQQAHLRAIELMNAYTANNKYSADTAGTFLDPPDIGGGSGNRSDTVDTSASGSPGIDRAPHWTGAREPGTDTGHATGGGGGDGATSAQSATGQNHPTTPQAALGQPQPTGGPAPTSANAFTGVPTTPATYLRESPDEFWDDTPPVAPPVIGENGS